MSTMHRVAAEALALFTNTDTRKSDDTGRNIWTIADHSACPKWVRDMCHAAHTDDDGADMMPNDWRYEMIVEALDVLSDTTNEDDAQARADEHEPPGYNRDRMLWLSSHSFRPAYCDEAAKESGGELDTLDRIAEGYLLEWRRVFAVVMGACRDEATDRDEA